MPVTIRTTDGQIAAMAVILARRAREWGVMDNPVFLADTYVVIDFEALTWRDGHPFPAGIFGRADAGLAESAAYQLLADFACQWCRCQQSDQDEDATAWVGPYSETPYL